MQRDFLSNGAEQVSKQVSKQIFYSKNFKLFFFSILKINSQFIFYIYKTGIQIYIFSSLLNIAFKFKKIFF